MREPEIATAQRTALPPDSMSNRQNSLYSAAQPRSSRPRILLIATLRWPIAARMASALSKVGFQDIEAVCPPQHPLETVTTLGKVHRFQPFLALDSIWNAINQSKPHVVVPCDDDATRHLHDLYAGSSLRSARGRGLRALIERSLGSPANCSVVSERASLMKLAFEEGIRAPATTEVESRECLEQELRSADFPVVVKTDFSWGGQGVRIMRSSDDIREGLDTLMSQRSLRFALVRLLLDRDPRYCIDHIKPKPDRISLQEYVAGTPANTAVLCWEGELLAAISVRVIETQHATGPATVVRVIENEEMLRAARLLVKRLGLSGFWGFDFMLERESEAAYLIEANPRATPISHLALENGQDLAAALYERLTGNTAAPHPVIPSDRNTIALFPVEWMRDPSSPYLRLAYYDVPWEEQALVQDCISPPWSDRGLLARLWARLKPLVRGRGQAGNSPRPELPAHQHMALIMARRHTLAAQDEAGPTEGNH